MNGGKIYQAIAGAMADITPIAKAKRNAQQGFAYRGIDDVMNELSPILAKRGIFIYPEVVKSERHERQGKGGGALLYSILTVSYHFAADDGSEIKVTVVGEGMDSGDKATNKAMSAAFKYACLQVFCIPTEDADDADASSPPQSKPKAVDWSPAKASEGKAIVARIGEIMTAKAPDGKPYFSEAAKDRARETVETNDLEKVRKLHGQLERVLAGLQADSAAGGFQDDDIPF